ncbi:MAG: hypothetical protein KAT35_01585, partial [Candidatus Aenigmarchaeota archaeon]|nr:hypothetical protein [Candidatus Aenigmarchaeota archaeon]
LSREVWVHIGISVGIALALVGIILGPVISCVNADIRDQATHFDKLVDGQADYFNDAVAATREGLRAEYDSFQGNMTQQWDVIDYTLASFDERLTIMQAELDQLQSGSWNEASAHMAGEYPNYTLHMRSMIGGNFTANVHLHYVPGMGNSSNYTAALDYFCTAVDWTMEDVPSYVCQPAFNGTAWVITDIWFNVGLFELGQDQDAALPVSCVGLNSTWVPTLVYVDVFRLSDPG